MPPKGLAVKRGPQPPIEQGETGSAVKQPAPEHAETMETGRPYREYVENEARKYWQEMVQPGSLAKPDQAEIRAAAMPILMRRLRWRQGKTLGPKDAPHRAHEAVCALRLYAMEIGWSKPPVSSVYASPDYVEALIQLGHDMGVLARRIPLPRTEFQEHPPIYYCIEPGTGRPRPREDALIDAAFVRAKTERLLVRDDSLARMDLEYGPELRRVTRNEYIYPDLSPPGRSLDARKMLAKGPDCVYTLAGDGENPTVFIHWVSHPRNMRPVCHAEFLSALWFARYPPDYFLP